MVPSTAKKKYVPRPGLWRLAAPIILLQLLSVGGGVFDAACLARFNLHALAASALGLRSYYVVLIFAAGISMGLGVRLAYVVSRARLLLQMLCQVMYLVLPLALCAYLFMAYFTPWLLLQSGQAQIMLAQLKFYLWPMGVAAALMLVTGVLRQLLLVLKAQNWLYPLALIYFISHVCFSYVLIFGHAGMPVLGLAGAAWSEMLSVGLNLILTLGFVLIVCSRGQFLVQSSKSVSANTVPAVPRKWWSPCWADILSLWRSSWPVASLVTLEMLAIMVIVLLLGRSGVHSLAAYQMVSQLDMLPFMIPYAVGMVMAVSVAQYVASDTASRIVPLVRNTLLQVTGLMLSCSLIFVALPQYILYLFFHVHTQLQPQIAVLAKHMLWCVAVYHVFNAGRKILLGALRGVQDLHVPMWVSLGCFWLVGVGGAYVAERMHGGPLAIWLALTAAMLLAAVGVCWRYVWWFSRKA